jgi:putative membrane protein
MGSGDGQTSAAACGVTIAVTERVRVTDRGFYAATAIVSATALAVIGWVLVVREHGPSTLDVRFLPGVNASLNAIAATLLVSGWLAIKRGARDVHKYCMVAAFAASSLFLVSYLTYHYIHGDTRFGGVGVLRVAYLLILASHVLLSMTIVPLALTSFYFAYTERFVRHRRIAKVTLPIWLYVSVTGVVIYFMLAAFTTR